MSRLNSRQDVPRSLYAAPQRVLLFRVVGNTFIERADARFSVGHNHAKISLALTYVPEQPSRYLITPVLLGLTNKITQRLKAGASADQLNDIHGTGPSS